MQAQLLKSNLQKISKATMELAKELSWNNFSGNIYYVIRPNVLEDSDHLDKEELINLALRRNELNKTLNIDQVIDRLCVSEKVPVWINVSIFKSNKNKTVIGLLTSRRFRNDDSMPKNNKFPPFHVAIPSPPYRKGNQKFDINWKHKRLKLKLYFYIFIFKKLIGFKIK